MKIKRGDLSDGWRRAERDERVGRLARAAREAKTLLFDVNVYECEEYEELCKALTAFDGEYESPEGQKGE